MNYHQFARSVQKCKKCKWSGKGNEAEIHESWSTGADYHCPECGYRFGYFAWPMTAADLAPERKPKKLPYGFRTMRFIKMVREWIGNHRR